jgi:DNA segregation ATPase FtsK/SpoIIIE, S-DNA-T family
LLANPASTQSAGTVSAWIGDPVAIKDPTTVAFRRLSGANVLIVGQQEESAIGILTAAMISIAAQQPASAAQFVVFDGSAADSPFAGTFARLASALPHQSKIVEWRQTSEAIDELAQELKRRQDSDIADAPSIFVVLYALQRYRVLRKSDDAFSFGSDEPKAPQPDRQFADLVREGPALGIHVLAWADTPAAVERTIERGLMREFDHRILFQMSANDSSNLIDSPAANKLGFNRALVYSEEQGVMEKFRAYAPPPGPWVQGLRERLSQRTPAQK